jgi:hypothetical protein
VRRDMVNLRLFGALCAAAADCPSFAAPPASAAPASQCVQTRAREGSRGADEVITTPLGRILLHQGARNADPAVLIGEAKAAGARIVIMVDGGEPPAREASAPVRILALHTASMGSSGLWTPGPNEVRVASGVIGTGTLDVLVSGSGAQAVRPVALLASERRTARTEVNWLGSTDSQPDASADVSGLEHLYSLVLKQLPTQRFSLHSDGSELPVGHSQAAVLGWIARQRACLANAISHGNSQAPLKPWAVVNLSRTHSSKNSLHVALQARADDGRSVAGVPVTFGRGLDLSCQTLTGPDGRAACELKNEHGEGIEDTDEPANPPTVATFAGRVGGDAVLLPTTAVFRP